MTHESDQVRQRRANLDALRALGVDVYPNRFDAEASVEAIVREHGGQPGEALETARPVTRVAGRILGIRSFGKANFLVIADGRERLQVYIRQDSLPEQDFAVFRLLDFGDWVGVEGRLFRTRTGELTVWASGLQMLAKCLLPLPEKWHGLQDVEIRYRQRYLDLIVNPDSRRVFEVRSRVVTALREFLIARGFLEVETPMMQPIAGGALARPFVTHHNALDMPLYLRVAPELYLKRLTVGGVERVFEINRNFRNEGISTQHNPEFTMLEFYWTYADYADLMTVTETLLADVAAKATGSTEATFGGHTISFAPPFRRLSLREAAVAAAGRRLGEEIDVAVLRSRETAATLAARLGVSVAPGAGAGRIAADLVEARLTPQGRKFDNAHNRLRSSGGADRSNDEFAGSTFSPDGKTLFVNIQAGAGMTFAIWGPWRRIGV
jgi:lysyl-tRNA synthetase class 2